MPNRAFCVRDRSSNERLIALVINMTQRRIVRFDYTFKGKAEKNSFEPQAAGLKECFLRTEGPTYPLPVSKAPVHENSEDLGPKGRHTKLMYRHLRG
jgi:hypothetical protein